MRDRSRITVAAALVLALAHALLPAAVLAGGPGARLEGLVAGVDGRAARGYRVHLIDEHGDAVAETATLDGGAYAFDGLPAGSYSLGIESPDGLVAPVAARPVRLGPGELARRDVRLVESDPAGLNQAANANYGLGMWWAGLSPAAKVWTIIGLVAVVAITAAALDDDDDEEAASPFAP